MLCLRLGFERKCIGLGHGSKGLGVEIRGFSFSTALTLSGCPGFGIEANVLVCS